jgi:hypothetical protein
VDRVLVGRVVKACYWRGMGTGAVKIEGEIPERGWRVKWGWDLVDGRWGVVGVEFPWTVEGVHR